MAQEFSESELVTENVLSFLVHVFKEAAWPSGVTVVHSTNACLPLFEFYIFCYFYKGKYMVCEEIRKPFKNNHVNQAYT